MCTEEQARVEDRRAAGVAVGDRCRFTHQFLKTMGLLGKRGSHAHWQTEGKVLGVQHHPDYRTRCKHQVTVEWANGLISNQLASTLERVR
jgi:hypothetical protein